MTPAERRELDLAWARKALPDLRTAGWDLAADELADAVATIRRGETGGSLERFVRWMAAIGGVPASLLAPA